MPATTINASLSREFVGSAVSSSLFGGIAINKYGYETYMEQANYLNLDFIRFPGGSVSENGIMRNGTLSISSRITLADVQNHRDLLAFDLTHPELMNPDLLAADDLDGGRNDVGSLSDAFAYARQTGGAASIILPVTRYYTGVDMAIASQRDAALAQAGADMAVFLNRLKSGAFNHGDLPTKIVLEIGNEAYGTPIEYALMAKVFIDKIHSILGNTGINVEIALQMNVGAQQLLKLDAEGYFDHYFNAAGQALIPQLAGMTFTSAADLSYAQRIVAIDNMMMKIVGNSAVHVDLLRHHFLAVDLDSLQNPAAAIHQRSMILDAWRANITHLGGNGDAVDYYASAWTTDSSNVGPMQYGMPAAVNTLALFNHFLDIGVDRAAVWGLIGSERFFPNATLYTTMSSADSKGMAPNAEVLRLMAESLPNMRQVSDGPEQGLVAGRVDDYLLYAFEDRRKVVVFLAVGELGGQDVNLSLNLGDFSVQGTVRADHVGTLGHTVGGMAVVETEQLTIAAGNLHVAFDQDWEVVRLTMTKATPGPVHGQVVVQGSTLGNNVYTVRSTGAVIATERQGGGTDVVEAHASYTLPNNVEVLRLMGTANLNGTGNAAADMLVGNIGNNTLTGNAGNDNMSGNGGADVLNGCKGNDILSGGAGTDILRGGDGADRLTGGADKDRLLGGEGADVFVFNSATDSETGLARMDDIADFVSRSDKIDLSGLDANAHMLGNQAFDFIGRAAFDGAGAASAGELHVRSFGLGNQCLIEADLNGDGVADFAAIVRGVSTLTAADFIL